MAFSITCQVLPDGRRNEIAPMFPDMQRFEFQAPTDRRLTVATAQFDGMQMNRVTSSGHTIRLNESDRGTYLVPHRGAIEVTTASGSFASKIGGALVFSPNTRTTRVTPPGSANFKATALLVDMEDLRAYLDSDELITNSDYIEQQFDYQFALPEELALRDYLGFLERELANRPLAFADPRVKHRASALMKELFGQLFLRLQTTSSTLPEDGGLDMAYIKRAEEYMKQRLDEPLTISHIAAATGVSVRRLQLIFKKLRRATPRETLTQFRLEKANTLLLAPNAQASVFQIALDSGFTHLGRFAAAYKARFGELPSETVRQARQAPTD